MKRISVQIADDSLQLLKRRALQKGISVSALVNEWITRGFQQTMSETEASPKNLERYVLWSLMLCKHQVVKVISCTFPINRYNQRHT